MLPDLVGMEVFKTCLGGPSLAGDVFDQFLDTVILLILCEIKGCALGELEQQLIEQGAGQAELLHLILEDLNKGEDKGGSTPENGGEEGETTLFKFHHRISNSCIACLLPGLLVVKAVTDLR